MTHSAPPQDRLPKQETTPQPEFVGTVEAAAIAKRGRRTIQTWAQSGKLRVAVRMPGVTGAVLFRREDVEALAASENDAAASTKVSAA